MTIGAVLLGLALLVSIVSIVLRPLVVRQRPIAIRPEDNEPPRLEAVLAALRDLDFDHQMGNLSEEDYAPARAGLMAQAAEAMSRNHGTPLEEVLEEKVREVRRNLSKAASARSCPSCGGGLLPGDRFCSSCGRAQTAACRACGRVVGPRDSYCTECGQRLKAQALPAADP